MLKRWQLDWNESPHRGKIPLYVISVVILLLCIDGAIENLRLHDYHEVMAEPLALIFLLLIFCIWPFRLATAVRRRGGSFTAWVYYSIIFSGPVIFIAYLARWRHKPILSGDSE